MSSIPWSRVSTGVSRARASSPGRSLGRGISGSPKRQAAIMMPAMSPLMAEGTIRRWRKKEGEAFQAGDVLLEIESDIATLDVEACSPGILGKILMPDGTSRVPIEQVIALVARDMDEYAMLQSSPLPVQDAMLTQSRPSAYMSSSSSSSSMSMSSSSSSSSRTTDTSKPLSSPRTTTTPRRLSLFEQQMQRGNRHAHVGGPLASPSRPPSRSASPMPMATSTVLHALDAVASSPSHLPSSRAPPRPRRDSLTPVRRDSELLSDAEQAQAQADGIAMRRRIVHNLAMRSSVGSSRDDFDAFLK